MKVAGWRSSLLAVLLLGAPAACDSGGSVTPDQAETRSASDLGVSRVVMYRSGIAYVERHGRAESNEVRLQIEPSQINDILTTLTVIVDRGENLAASIGLPIERTVAADLDNLPPQVRQEGGMLALLQAFRGAEVQIRTATGSAEGRVVGTEALVNDDGNLIRRVTLMTEDGELLQFRVDEIIEARLLNDSLEVGLAKALDVSLGEGDWKPVELVLRLTGEAPHDVFVSYVVAMPTWKPTYRLLVDDERVHLQGWAVVDNISGEDWRDVDLSLVAGTPISFRYDLHSPRFVSRPDVTSRGFEDELSLVAPDIDRGLIMPQSQTAAPGFGATGDIQLERAARESRARPEEEPSPYDGDYGGGEYYARDEAEEQALMQLDSRMLVDSMQSSAATEQLDALFRYDVEEPVTVSDRGSALVAIINEAVTGEDVLYFDPHSPSPHAAGTPYRAVRLENTSAFTVERGPLTIFKDDTFVGQALSPRIGAGEMLFLPYSMDGRFRLTEVQSTGEEGVRLVRVVNSVIYSEVQQVNRRTYQITNNSNESARLYIRVPKQTNWTLRQPAVDAENVLDQGDVWFVAVELDAGPARDFVIEEVTTVTRSVEIWSDLAAETIGLYVSNADVDPQVAATLQTVLEQRNRTAEVERELDRLRRLRQEVYQRMAEVRANLDILGDTRQARELRSELETRLGSLEEDATNHTIQVVALEDEQSELRARIATTLMDLNLDPSDDQPTNGETPDPREN